MKIKAVKAAEILDSRGEPTVECQVFLEDGSVGWAAVPSGASTGKYEAVELRDNEKRFHGKGVRKAVENVNQIIAKEITGFDAEDQPGLDKKLIELDGTENKSNLGANAILAVSSAAARAQASAEQKPLYQYLTKFNPFFDNHYLMPLPQMNVINGGKHANWATDIQEYMLLPIGAKSFAQAVEINAEIFFQLKNLLKKSDYAITVGDEGGFAPTNFKDNEEPFQFLVEAIKAAGYQPGSDVVLGIDAAASEFFNQDHYQLKKEGKDFSSDQLIDFYQQLQKKYPIVSIEDCLAEDDWSGFQKLTEKIGQKTQIVGDDLYVTNRKRLEKGIREKATNAILIKLNQIGTLTETVETIITAKKAGFKTIISHRSGETEDTFIADLAVAMNAGQIKSGAPCRSERTAKYNRLLRIERELQETQKKVLIYNLHLN
jgi:enolase